MLAVAGSSSRTKKVRMAGLGAKSATLFLMRGDGSTLRILGPVELIGPAGPVRLGAAKERCLLAVLALHLGEAVSQDQLAEALWGEHAPRSADQRAAELCPAAAARSPARRWGADRH